MHPRIGSEIDESRFDHVAELEPSSSEDSRLSMRHHHSKTSEVTVRLRTLVNSSRDILTSKS